MVRSTWCAFRWGFNKVESIRKSLKCQSFIKCHSFIFGFRLELPSKTAKLCFPPIFSLYGSLAGN